MRIKGKRLGILIAFLTPLWLTLSFPKFDFSCLAWICLVPLLVAISRLKKTEAFIFSWMIGWVAYQGIFSWIYQVEGFSFFHGFLAGLYLGFYVGLFGLLIKLPDSGSYSYPVFVALIWVTLEYIRSNLLFLAFPWALLGQTQYQNINLIQISSITGVYGISFLVALVNASVAMMIDQWVPVSHQKWRKKDYAAFGSCLAPILFIIMISLWGMNIQKRDGVRDGIRLGVVQGNIAQDIKWKQDTIVWTFDRYEALTKEVAQEKPSLIIWPETAIPLNAFSYPRVFWRILTLSKGIQTPIIFGAAGAAKVGVSENKSRQKYNSAFYCSSGGKILGEYQKIRLLPFGEYIPSLGRVSFSFLNPGLKGKFDAGSHIKLFPLNEASFGVTICWENIFPNLFRGFVLKGASFMINISNDAWFKDSAGPHQHLMCQVFRAVEHRIAIARAANTGISCFIDPFGRIIKRVEGDAGKDLNVSGVAYADIPLKQRPTFYTLYGDVFVLTCMIILGLGLFYQVMRKIVSLRLRGKETC